MKRFKIASLAVLAMVLMPIAQTPSAQERSWRPTVVAQHGMVAAGHPLAAEAGMRILKAGGNAIDAAMATWAVQGEVEPGMTGLGADMFVLVLPREDAAKVKFINGHRLRAGRRRRSTSTNRRAAFRIEGPLSISVPGAVGGAAYAVQNYGTKPLAEVLAPAIEIAEQGFPITRVARAGLAGGKDKLEKYPSTTKIWFRNGKPLQMGDILINPGSGAHAADDRRAGSRRASTKARSRRTPPPILKANGGLITEADLARLPARSKTPRFHVNYRGVEVYECPPNSQGFVMLEALNILEGFDLKEMGHNSAPYLHAVTEALKLSFADRNSVRRRPEVRAEHSDEESAVEGIRGGPSSGDRSEHARSPASRRPAIRRAITDDVTGGAAGVRRTAAGCRRRSASFDPDKILNLTTYLAVVDKDHNMVSVTSSLLSGFGSGMRGRWRRLLPQRSHALLVARAGNVNALQPGKRVRQTINPALALKDGKPFVVFGTPGADHAATNAAAVLPQRRRVRDGSAAGARAAVGHQQQLPATPTIRTTCSGSS